MQIIRHSLAVALFVALVFIAVVAAQSQQKSGLSLSEKVENLLGLNAKKAVMRFNGQKFREYIKNPPRNYSVIVMLTALSSSRQCQICRHALDEYVIVATSYRQSPVYSSKLFFVMVDFDEGGDVFKMLRINTAPVFMHFPAKGMPKPSDIMDIHRVGLDAEAIANFVEERTGVQIGVFRPPNYAGTLGLIAILSLVGGFLYVRRNNLDFLYNKQLWAAIAVFICLTMTSGQMWNHIRNPPLLHKTQSGGVAYIHGSSQGQLVVESFIVMFLNGMIALGMIVLTESNSQSDERTGRLMTILGLGLVVLFFSFLLSVFRSKAHGYPYSLLFS